MQPENGCLGFKHLKRERKGETERGGRKRRERERPKGVGVERVKEKESEKDGLTSTLKIIGKFYLVVVGRITIVGVVPFVIVSRLTQKLGVWG